MSNHCVIVVVWPKFSGLYNRVLNGRPFSTHQIKGSYSNCFSVLLCLCSTHKSEPCKCRCGSGVEQLPCKHQVGGSNPSIGSIVFVKDSNSNDLQIHKVNVSINLGISPVIFAGSYPLDEDKTVRHKF